MKKEEKSYHKFDSITDFHRIFALPKPLHPLISLLEVNAIKSIPAEFPDSFILNFYQVTYKTDFCGKAKYGQNYYDFGEGGLIFSSPDQLFETPRESGGFGYSLLIHPDFFLTYPLTKKITNYGFFSYSANEALHLSDNEKLTILSMFKIIDDELKSRIDDFTQDVIISQVELLLNYSNRFYKRQFITRKAVNSELLQQMQDVLRQYFADEKSLSQGIPTVQYLSEKLNMTPRYLSDLLRALTGQSAQQHIHHMLIEKAKEKLSTTSLSVSEVAYALGFEHSQSFSKFFKTKAKLSPLEFRRSFN